MSIIDRLTHAANLPSLPTVAIEVLRLAKSDDVSVDAIAKVVQNDPALSAKLLRVVNSPLFGVAREVASIKQAMVILGLRTVKVMALSFSLVEALRASDADEFDLAAFWRRSVLTSVAARLLARAVNGRLSEEAFVSGLLADIGMFVGARCVPEEYRKVARLCHAENIALVDAEKRVFGATHAELGRALLEKWSLPDLVCRAVGAHHGDGIAELAGPDQTMAKVVHCAARLAALFAGEAPPSELGQVKQAIVDSLGVDASKIESMLEALTTHVRQTASLLSLDIGTTVTYPELQAAAAAQLAEMSVEAELERAQAAAREQAARAEATRLTEEKKTILEVASTDGLTKVANRAAFDQRIAEEHTRARETGRSIGVIMLDVDHFKKFNDLHGHRAGDEVLRTVASCIQSVAGRAGLVARYGGEEFVVLALDESARKLAEIAEEVRRVIERTQVRFEGKTLGVTASLGVAQAPAKDATLGAILEQADQRMYAAKRAGRNRVQTA
ncbi:MAG: GGDEF domain-containing protein [Phycisphaerales bacterium]|nr:GGDEF domain-containing protein [Phycisphaerales bacterium]